MVISFTVVATIISTIVVVTMASILRCCWPKKESKDLNEKKKKKTSKSESSTKDKCITLGVKSGNGIVVEPQSDSKLPLLSSAVTEINEDSGDFSAVQRETEILRPELYDKEDNIHNSDKENEEAGEILLRADMEKSKRDTRSSMLTEIEQTIAAIHMAQQSNVVDLPHENNARSSNGLIQVKDISNNDWRSSVESDCKQTSSQLAQLPDIKSESALPARKDSPKVSPIAKSRTGPKVSPKPSPKVRSKILSHDNTILTSETIRQPLDNLDRESILSSHKMEMERIMAPVVDTLPQPTCLENNAKPKNMENQNNSLKTVNNLPENNTITKLNAKTDLTRPQSPSCAGQENLEITKEQKNEDIINSSSCTTETLAGSEAATNSENMVEYKTIDGDSAETFRKNVSLEITESPHVDKKFDNSINKEKVDEHALGNEKISKDNSEEKENEHTLVNKIFSNSLEKKNKLPIDDQRFSRGNSVEIQKHILGKQGFTGDSMEIQKHILGKQGWTGDSVDKEDEPPLDGQIISIGNSVEKEVEFSQDSQLYSNDNNQKKENENTLENELYSKTYDVEKESKLQLENKNVSKGSGSEKTNEPIFGKQRFSKDNSVEKEDHRKSEGETIVTNGKETLHSINGHLTQNGTEKLATKVSRAESVESTQQSSPEREINSSQNEDTNRGRSQQPGQQRRESTEDQTGKGKTSKIPVRAGSKPRTSPPKLTNPPS